MDNSSSYGRFTESIATGTSNHSFTVPFNRIAIIQCGLTSGSAEIKVGSDRFQTGIDKTVFTFADAGETVDITFTSASGQHYQILTLYKVF